jgi:hypothetical protein
VVIDRQWLLGKLKTTAASMAVAAGRRSWKGDGVSGHGEGGGECIWV